MMLIGDVMFWVEIPTSDSHVWYVFSARAWDMEINGFIDILWFGGKRGEVKIEEREKKKVE